ncbi:MAG: lipoyl(octanoyl) transferase LipB [Rickettsiales bacterium]|nr:lipoyl(octanoyl) transferase LipB [Rickettsiales bacterium]
MGNNVFVINEPAAYADAMKWFEEPYQEDKVFILEHQDVYTCGKSVSEEEFARVAHGGTIMGTPAIRASRGGLWTWHGKEQIVVYFICNLHKNHMTLDDWFQKVEGAVLESLNDIIKQHNVQGVNVYADKDKRGFWMHDARGDVYKIGFIGLRVSKGILTHGISINFDNDLKWFDYITPCGLEGVRIGSITNNIAEAASKKVFLEGMVRRFEK